MPLPAPIYASGDFTVAKVCSGPVFSAPFPGVNIDYVLKQEFMRFTNNRAPLALGTAHPEYPDFKLAEEHEPMVDGGIDRWTRVYVKTPATWEEPTTFNYQFPALYPGVAEIVDGVLQQGRAAYQKTVTAKMVFDYFEADSEEDVTVIPAQQYGFKNSGTGTPYPAYAAAGMLWPAGQFANVDTNPTMEEYLAWRKGQANEQMIVAQDSTVRRWMGRVFERQTIYVWPE